MRGVVMSVLVSLVAGCGDAALPMPGDVHEGAPLDAAPTDAATFDEFPFDIIDASLHCDNVYTWCQDGIVYEAIPDYYATGCNTTCGSPTSTSWDYITMSACPSGCASPDAGGGQCGECEVYPPLPGDCPTWDSFVGCAP